MKASSSYINGILQTSFQLQHVITNTSSKSTSKKQV